MALPSHVPSPADVPTMTAVELVEKIRAEDGRVLRMKVAPSVFVLTSNPELAAWLAKKGAKTAHHCPQNGYPRARDGKREWDLWITGFPVLGEQTIWDAAAK